MSEDDLARLMHNKFCPTKLGSEQKKVAGKTRIVVPPDIKSKECYQSCVIAARSARTKFNRQQEAVAKAQEKGFGKTSKIHTFVDWILYFLKPTTDSIKHKKTYVQGNG